MKIRQATSIDSLLLSSLCVDVQSLHAKHYPDFFKIPQSDNFAVDFFDGMLIERPENLFKFSTRYLDVDQISVRPAAQGKGVGKALLIQVDALARELNIQRIQLDSWGFNTTAHAFFEQMGFEKFNHRFWKKL